MAPGATLVVVLPGSGRRLDEGDVRRLRHPSSCPTGPAMLISRGVKLEGPARGRREVPGTGNQAQ